MLLIHSINAAGSAYEVGPFWEALRRERRVYAVDLPGFGFSDRSERGYDVRLYVEAIHDMLDEIATESGGGAIDTLALSLSSEFLARAANERPDAFRSLVLITPTGFERGAHLRRGPEDGTREVKGLHVALNIPVWSRGLYNLLVSRPSIGTFLERTFGSKQIDEGLLDYDYLTAHQPGAKNAPYAFVAAACSARTCGRVRAADSARPSAARNARRSSRTFRKPTGRGRARTGASCRSMRAPCPQFERLPDVMAELRPFLQAPPALNLVTSRRRARDPRARIGAAWNKGSAG
jgi:pimeloyl-ACP methyl ester carboxylesterase